MDNKSRLHLDYEQKTEDLIYEGNTLTWIEKYNNYIISNKYYLFFHICLVSICTLTVIIFNGVEIANFYGKTSANTQLAVQWTYTGIIYLLELVMLLDLILKVILLRVSFFYRKGTIQLRNIIDALIIILACIVDITIGAISK